MKNKNSLLKVVLVIVTAFIAILFNFNILPYDIVNKIMFILSLISLMGFLLVEIKSKEKSTFLIVFYLILIVLEVSQFM